jgi:hypothetical protein
VAYVSNDVYRRYVRVKDSTALHKAHPKDRIDPGFPVGASRRQLAQAP